MRVEVRKLASWPKLLVAGIVFFRSGLAGPVLA